MQVDQSLKLNFPFFAVCHTSDNVVRIRYACSDDANLELNRTDVWQERKLWANFFVSAKLQAFYLFPYQFIRYVLRISVNAGFRSTFFENQKNWVKKSDFRQKIFLTKMSFLPALMTLEPWTMPKSRININYLIL